MSTTIIAFFNNKGGVGKTSLVYHLAWMYSSLGYRVIAADLDPQSSLTTAFLDEESLEKVWLDNNHKKTIFGCIQPLINGIGDIREPELLHINNSENSANNISLLVGDILLAEFEYYLSQIWHESQIGNINALQSISAFWRILKKAAISNQADIILMDLGPNLGAINHAALIAADYVVIPLLLDKFALYGLRNLAKTFSNWRENWKNILNQNMNYAEPLPAGLMQAIGYVIWQLPIRLDRPVNAYNHLIYEIPKLYREAMFNQPQEHNISLEDDPYCLALLKNYQSLMRMAQEAHKPMFHLKPADGAIGAHSRAAKNVYQDFRKLALKIVERTQIRVF
ncbi:putative regulatory protein cII [Nostoc carneum NIES-2107]|nr:putative regulatory protein cII [Nostoc carneum NIES-2107]